MLQDSSLKNYERQAVLAAINWEKTSWMERRRSSVGWRNVVLRKRTSCWKGVPNTWAALWCCGVPVVLHSNKSSESFDFCSMLPTISNWRHVI